MEERERLEEENERIEEQSQSKSKSKTKKDVEEGENEDTERILSDEEIDERCEALRVRLTKEMEAGNGDVRRDGKDRRLKSYQVHELAEAKMVESERLRRALGIREDGETGEISSLRRERREKERERD